MAAIEQRKIHEDAIRKETQENGYEMPFNPQLYRLALETATPYGWDGIDKTTFSIIAEENTESQKHRLRILESPGQTGEKAVPYSERGFEIDLRVRLYMDSLSTDGTYIMDKADSYSMEDLQILTAETGVEYTLLTIDGKSYLIRGNERGTTIPEDIAKSLYDKQGEFVCHSHPYIGDLKPSKSDLEFIKSLTWQTDSVIIDPTGDMIIYDQYGVREKKHNQPIRNENYYNDIFG